MFPGGPDEEISDPDAIISAFDGLTCEVGAELARHVVNETSCEIDVKPYVDVCCRPKPTNLPVVPTAAPTESSAPASKSAVALISGMLMVSTMMMMLA